MTTETEQATDEPTTQATSQLDKAIVLDLGKKKPKQIKQLRKGRGKLLGQIDEQIQELRWAGALEETTQPVIVVVSEKPERVSWL